MDINMKTFPLGIFSPLLFVILVSFRFFFFFFFIVPLSVNYFDDYTAGYDFLCSKWKYGNVVEVHLK